MQNPAFLYFKMHKSREQVILEKQMSSFGKESFTN